MPIQNRFAELLPEITAWRRDIHENPELMFDTHRTSGLVAAKLREFGCDEVVEGIGTHRRGGRDQGQDRRERPGDRASGGYGCAADLRGDGVGLCLENPGQDACLRA